MTVPEPTPPATPRPPAAPTRERPPGTFAPSTTLTLCPGARPPLGYAISGDRSLIGYSPVISTPAGPLMRAPVDAACLSSPFGMRLGVGAGSFHRGLDLANRAGSMIRAAGDGRIIFSGEAGEYGRMVRILHGAGTETLYAHLAPESVLPEIGAPVFRGEVIGQMGKTGNATGVHLHFEVYINGTPVDPLSRDLPPAGA